MADARPATVAVAFSGGRDSLALLHATCRSAAALGLQVVALHVHHGLLPEADGWLIWAQRLCVRWRRRGWPLRLRWARLSGQPAPGDSLEAWARAGRYGQLARLASEEGASLLLLAQHRRDQAETVLLQALRGGGPAGLSAMPAMARRDGLVWARPWLQQPRRAIEAYVVRHRLKPVEDPSNADLRLARNRLRLQVWPALQAAFDDAEAALAGAAQRAQEAQAVLDEMAALDLVPLVDPHGHLQVAGWRQLSAGRQANALRAWWRGQTGRGAPNALVGRLLSEVPVRGSARWPAGAPAEPGTLCVLYRGALQVVAASPRTAAPPEALTLDLSAPGRYPVPAWGGTLVLSPCLSRGLALARLRSVTLRLRRGGERFQLQPDGLARSLKKQYQQAGVAGHARGGPLLWGAEGQLLFVPGLGIDTRWLATEGEPQLSLSWCSDAPLSAVEQSSG